MITLRAPLSSSPGSSCRGARHGIVSVSAALLATLMIGGLARRHPPPPPPARLTFGQTGRGFRGFRAVGKG